MRRPSLLRFSNDCDCEAQLSQTGKGGRKELTWTRLSDTDRKVLQDAAVKQWQVWLESQAVSVLSRTESLNIQADLTRRGELDRILQPRFVVADKNDILRTELNPLALNPSARIVVPGFNDRANLQ